MATVKLAPFTGLDLRPEASDEDGALVEALNVIVDDSGALVRRPGLNFRVRLPVATVGLYGVGNQLRSLAFHGVDDTGLAPTVYLDYCETDITGAELLGAMVASDGTALVLVELTGGATQMHHCPTTSTDPAVTTRITWSGTPAFAFIGMESRGWALDQNLSTLWYSAVDAATPARLDDWGVGSIDDVSSEGSLSVGQFAAGAGRPTALGEFGGRLAIFYEGATQVWRLDTDKTRLFKEAVMPAVGTKHARSIASIIGDVMLLTNAGVRSLTTVTQTLDPAEDPVGSKVDSLANQWGNETGARPVAIYARRLGCYLLAFGTDVLCLSMTPGKKLHGWSRWELPVPVEYFAEANGLVWMRSGRDVFSLGETDDDDTDHQGGTAHVPVRWETAGKVFQNGVDVEGFSTTATEPHRAQTVVDGRPAVDNQGGMMGSPVTMPGRAPVSVKCSQAKQGTTVGLRGQDDATAYGWRLHAASLHLSPRAS